MKKAKAKMVNVHTRIPSEVAEAIASMATPETPVYRVMRSMLVSAIKGVPAGCNLDLATIRELGAVADKTGFKSIGELLSYLAAAFLRVYRYNSGQLAEDEQTPPEEIRDMFEEVNIKGSIYAEKLSIRKGT